MQPEPSLLRCSIRVVDRPVLGMVQPLTWCGQDAQEAAKSVIAFNAGFVVVQRRESAATLAVRWILLVRHPPYVFGEYEQG